MEDHIYKKVEAIIFGVFSPKLIKKVAAAKIVNYELYDKEGYPVDGGLMDVRLGVIDPGLRCKTCGGKLKRCIGHFGYLELARPIVHVKYVSTILNFLRATCRECGRVLADEEKINNYLKELDLAETQRGLDVKRKRISTFLSHLKTIKKCPHCKAKQDKITLEKPTTFLGAEKRIDLIEVRSRLERISDSDVMILGLNPEYARPEWMILTLLPIPPVTMRPSITLDTGERSEDDLTHKLGDIVRINQRLFENINAGAPEIIIEDLWDLLQYHVTTFFDNDIASVPPSRHRSGQPLRTLTERIKSKEGRFRYNLAGKRVNFSARTVISPDPKIKFNEVGVPLSVATELTVPETVTEWNINWLKEFVKKGSTNYPGANYVIRPDGKKKRITNETMEQLLEELQPGCIVERHLMDGDICLFNRQPSLHRMSIMCHRIRVLPGRSFRLNPSICVAPDTLVQLSSGIQRPIDELKNCWKESELLTYDKREGLTKTELKKFWGLKPEEYGTKCYKVSTESGRSITTTGDHPFYLKNSIKRASEIEKGDLPIIRPLDTPHYEEINRLLVREEDILKNSPKETYIKHTLNTLKELKLLPLNMMDQRVMIIARLLGHLFGDGTFILKKDSGRMIFRGSKKDLENIQRDIESLGFKPEKIYIKTVDNKIETIKGKILEVTGSGHDFEIRNKPLAILFSCLGAPNGDKVKLKYRVPEWIISSPKYIQREFLASYFGSEMTKPVIRKKSECNFRSFVFKISKIDDNIDSGREFIEDIKNILNNFGVKLELGKTQPGNKRKDGYSTRVLSGSINDESSKINLLGKIGFIYDSKKDNIARLSYQYMLLKQKNINERNGKYKIFKDLREKKYKFKEISAKLGISISCLEDWAYKVKKAGLVNDFISFKEWCKKNADLENGFVYEKISSIEETYVPFVYDITTTLDTHNFFANGFLTKNCTPYNADFDGDEMNLHVPQTEEARAEAELLMSVQHHIITPKNGLNIVGCIQDSIAGLYLLTKKMNFSKDEAVELLTSIGITDSNKFSKFKDKVTGKEVFSAILPEDFSFIGYSREHKEDENNEDAIVRIKNGQLISGIIDKATVGEENGSLIRSLYANYDENVGIEILSKMFKLGNGVLLRHGFTTGLSDTDLPEKTKEKYANLLEEGNKEINELIESYKKNNLEALPALSIEETLELKILEILNRIRNKIGEAIANNADENNPTIIMAKSGSVGSTLNLAQMAACVGQQAVRGKRVETGYKNRTLSIFKRNELSSAAKGFIESGFKKGLNPYEYFFGAITGRDSLMDVALRTPKSGYLYRRLANALQDLRLEYDNTVRDATKKIIQFKYGEDGIDVSKSEGGTINVKKFVDMVKAL